MKRIVLAAILSSTFSIAVQPALTQGTVTVSEPPPASGWIGVNTLGQDSEGKIQYPVIMSVVDHSPADSAGLIAGDTILKFGDIDARADPFGLRRLLKPGLHVQLKIRHNGIRTITVVARKRPSTVELFWGLSTGNTQKELAPIVAPPAMRATMIVSGANLTQLNAGLAEVLHVQNKGILVIDVGPETPAMRAGLKGGDLIVKADSVRVTTPTALSRVISAKAAHDSADPCRCVALDIVRMGKERKVTLRW